MGHLARHVARHSEFHELVYPGWYALNGPALVRILAAQQPRGMGRPRAETETLRLALRLAVAGTHEAQRLTKSALAELASISRPTLDDWIRANASKAPTYIRRTP